MWLSNAMAVRMRANDSSPGFLGCRKWFSQLHAKIFAWWEKFFEAFVFLPPLSKVIFWITNLISREFLKVHNTGFKNFCMLQKFYTLILQPRKTPLLCLLIPTALHTKLVLIKHFFRKIYEYLHHLIFWWNITLEAKKLKWPSLPRIWESVLKYFWKIFWAMLLLIALVSCIESMPISS